MIELVDEILFNEHGDVTGYKHWGPRALRSLKMKYLLIKLLLNKLNEVKDKNGQVIKEYTPDPAVIIPAIKGQLKKKYKTAFKEIAASNVSDEIKNIVKQVI